jgi:hypothetical protein
MDGRDALEVHASTFSRLFIMCITIGFPTSFFLDVQKINTST